ncbi:MAG: cupin domain-containing protein [Candidatus Sericytochromatia bacterium]|nr:cupin domain-containing protein [Candidatus Sericytochromatia bacterium]
MKPFQINVAELPWESYAHGRFGSDDKAVAGALRAERLDYVLTRLGPGQISSPYHAHHAGEELFVIIEGSGRLRYDGEEKPLRVGDFISCPPGSASAHQIWNDGDVPLLYWAISTVEPLEICEYPDSGKLLVKAAGRDGRDGLQGIFRQGDTVDYFLDEG